MEFIKSPYAKRGTKLNYNPYRYKNGDILNTYFYMCFLSIKIFYKLQRKDKTI